MDQIKVFSEDFLNISNMQAQEFGVEATNICDWSDPET